MLSRRKYNGVADSALPIITKGPLKMAKKPTRKFIQNEVLPVIKQHFGNILPAATMVVAGMVDEKMKIEIEVTCFKGA